MHPAAFLLGALQGQSKAPLASGGVAPEQPRQPRPAACAVATTQDDADPSGAIALDSLCTVVPPLAKARTASTRRATVSVPPTEAPCLGPVRAARLTVLASSLQQAYSFTLNTATTEWTLFTKTVADANRWVTALQVR